MTRIIITTITISGISSCCSSSSRNRPCCWTQSIVLLAVGFSVLGVSSRRLCCSRQTQARPGFICPPSILKTTLLRRADGRPVRTDGQAALFWLLYRTNGRPPVRRTLAGTRPTDWRGLTETTSLGRLDVREPSQNDVTHYRSMIVCLLTGRAKKEIIEARIYRRRPRLDKSTIGSTQTEEF